MLDGEVTLARFRHGSVEAGPERGAKPEVGGPVSGAEAGATDSCLVSSRMRDLCSAPSFASLSRSHSNPRYLDFGSALTKLFPVLGSAKLR